MAALKEEYSTAEEIRHDDEGTRCEWVEAILRYLGDGSNGRQLCSTVPLDIQATAFQWQVWQELRVIPYGETRSYGEIARALGDVKKARAVANACASNPVALVIPCHRVVRENGNSGGYRWGSERKQRLLAQEQEQEATASGTSFHHSQRQPADPECAE